MQNDKTNEFKPVWGVHSMVFRSYDRFQMVRSAVDKQAYIDGKLSAIFLTKEEAEAENSPVISSHTPL